MRISFPIGLICCVGALLAAGCSGSPLGANQPPSDAQTVKWAQCMQQHGVQVTVTDSGNGVSVHSQARAPGSAGPGADAQQAQAAQAACKQYRPNGGGANQQPSAQQLDQAAKYVQCLNQHGSDAQVGKDGGIMEQPGPGGPEVEAQADQACKSLAPGGGR